jgi:hypothetical protein
LKRRVPSNCHTFGINYTIITLHIFLFRNKKDCAAKIPNQNRTMQIKFWNPSTFRSIFRWLSILYNLQNLRCNLRKMLFNFIDLMEKLSNLRNLRMNLWKDQIDIRIVKICNKLQQWLGFLDGERWGVNGPTTVAFSVPRGRGDRRKRQWPSVKRGREAVKNEEGGRKRNGLEERAERCEK